MTALLPRVAMELALPVPEEVGEFAAAIASHCGASAQAVLFYGSCLRETDLRDSLLDFYLLVDSYERAYSRKWLATANRLLPPNVFYIERAGLRAKYAVMTVADFERACTIDSPSVSVWARFAQPSRLVWARGDLARAQVARAVANAAPTLLAATRPLLPDVVEVETLWTRAFSLTYGAELRSETADRSASLYAANRERYAAFTAPALAAAGLLANVRNGVVQFSEAADSLAAARLWKRMRRNGKLLSAARLAKASFTFSRGIDYIAWKISRHAGTEIEVKAWHRRLPLLAGMWLLPRLLRRGAVR